MFVFSSPPPAPGMVIPSRPEAGLACVTSKTRSQRSLRPPQALWGRATMPLPCGDTQAAPRETWAVRWRGGGGPITPPPGPPRDPGSGSATPAAPPPPHSRTRSTFLAFSLVFLHAFEGMSLAVSPEVLRLLKWGGDSNVLCGKEPDPGLTSPGHAHRDFPRDVREQRL